MNFANLIYFISLNNVTGICFDIFKKINLKHIYEYEIIQCHETKNNYKKINNEDVR